MSEYLSIIPNSTAEKLYDLGQVSSSLCALVSLSVRGIIALTLLDGGGSDE